jgi:mRNA interferase MazF
LAFGEAMVENWQNAGLIKPSVFKPVFSTLDPALVLRCMGELSPVDAAVLRETLVNTFD